jgi:hypothetical protein
MRTVTCQPYSDHEKIQHRCTEYYHKAELFDSSSVYLRFLGPMLMVPKGWTVNAIRSVREDYVDSIDYLPSSES